MSRLMLCAVAAAVGWLVGVSSVVLWLGLARVGDNAKSLHQGQDSQGESRRGTVERVSQTELTFATYKVKPEQLPVQFSERGALESAENREVTCRVKAKVQGGVASTIRWVIDEGTQVQAGDKLMELDDSPLQDNLKNQKITLDRAKADWVAGKENYSIILGQTESDIESAYLNLEVAQIKLLQYKEGTYLQAKRGIEGQMEIAKVTISQAQSDAARKVSARLALETQIEAMRVLEEYDSPTNIKILEGAVEEAWRAISLVEAQARAKQVFGLADLKSKEWVYDQQLSLYYDAEEEVRKCRILAPQAGAVVYYVPETTRGGQSTQGLVVPGETVKEGQKMLRISDLSQMVVNVKVHEAMVSKVRGDKWRSTSFTDTVQASMLASMPQPLLSLSTQAAFEENRLNFMEQYKKAEQVPVSQGPDARIRIDAFPGRTFKGHVKTVATMPSQADFMSSGVKVYQTMVAIDESLPDLKPGMTAAATIDLGKTLENVLVVPARALIGKASIGKTVSCLVLTKEGIEEREVVVGLFHDAKVGIESGLREGDEVIVNPRLILDEIHGLIRLRGK